ncbi:MAG: hypothetical protein AB7F96_09145 [Beijerinckiaceae bacterium]
MPGSHQENERRTVVLNRGVPVRNDAILTKPVRYSALDKRATFDPKKIRDYALADTVFLAHENKSLFYEIVEDALFSAQPRDNIEALLIVEAFIIDLEARRLRKFRNTFVMGISTQDTSEVLEKYINNNVSASDMAIQLVTEMQINGVSRVVNYIERFDKLISMAEARRHAVLRELSRYGDAVSKRLERNSLVLQDPNFSEE